jgi:hypothetical protein
MQLKYARDPMTCRIALGNFLAIRHLPHTAQFDNPEIVNATRGNLPAKSQIINRQQSMDSL